VSAKREKMAVAFFVPDLSDIKNRNLELEKEKMGRVSI
jgi:hypothetical protein